MTFAITIECDVCHSKHLLKIQGDHVMNRSDMPFRIGCQNCGNEFVGTIGVHGFHIQNAQQVKGLGELFPDIPTVAISDELPISRMCYFPKRFILNNIMALRMQLDEESIRKHSLKMQILADNMTETFEHLRVLYNIKQSGNIDAFKEYALRYFNKDKDEDIVSPNSIRIGFVNLYVQLFDIVRSSAYIKMFATPFVNPYADQVKKFSSEQINVVNGLIAPYMNLQNDMDKAIEVLLSFWNKRLHFYPVMLLMQEGDFDKLYKDEFLLSTTDFNDIKILHAEMFELLCRFSMYMVAIENFIHRDDFDLLSTSKPLSNYCKIANGNKSEFIITHSTLKDYYKDTLNHKVRNGIDHVKTKYDSKSQIITYYPDKNDPNLRFDISLIDFTFITLQQAVKLSETIFVVYHFL